MAKESNGRVHASSRAGAAGLMQFMPATGRRFGLGPDGTGFDTRFDARSAAEASAKYLNERMRELKTTSNCRWPATTAAGPRAARLQASRRPRLLGGQRLQPVPGETKDYVPMVIAAAWIFLHPQQYGVEFPKVNAQPATSAAQVHDDLRADHLPGQPGHARWLHARAAQPQPALRGRWLDPGRYPINATTRIAGLYTRNCVDGPRADLARTLITAAI